MKEFPKDLLSRAQGCLMGQCAGDALGQMVEFRSKDHILAEYPDGVRDMADGGAFHTIAGQPTDDTEMALMLARSLVRERRFDAEKVREAYRFWHESRPFDCGATTAAGLNGMPNFSSQANGSLMRVSPLGVFGYAAVPENLAQWAMADSRLTHPNEVCQKAVAIYVVTVAEAVRTGAAAAELYENALRRVRDENVFRSPEVLETLQAAADGVPEDFSHRCGWVLLALQNAFYRLLHAENTEQAIIATVNEGGDTDTTAAICGALLGAVHGLESIPLRWRETVLGCRPCAGTPGVKHPRPECFWPVDVPQLAEELLHHDGRFYESVKND